MLAGVCGGLARYLNLDPALVRIVTVLLTLLVGGVPVIVYLVAMLVVPEDDRVSPPLPSHPTGWSPQPPSAAPGSRLGDPVWGSEGAPWEQPQATSPAPSAPATAAPDPDAWPRPGTDAPSGSGQEGDPQRPDAR